MCVCVCVCVRACVCVCVCVYIYIWIHLYCAYGLCESLPYERLARSLLGLTDQVEHHQRSAVPTTTIDSPCECEHNNPDSLDARLFFTVVLAVAPAVTMDEASFLSQYTYRNTIPIETIYL